MRRARGTRRLVLHVGAGKCGSSSLQRYLTDHPELRLRDGSTARYWCILPQETLSPEEIRRRGARADVAYCHSGVEAESLADFDQRLHRVLDKTPAGDCVVISSEKLTQQWRLGPELTALRRDDVRADAVLFVRPQVDWIASAWWQWGIWTGVGFPGWIDHGIRASDWAGQAKAWEQVPGVASVTVLEAGGDVIGRFLGYLGAAPDPAARGIRANTSSSRALLGFLQRQRRFREGVHASFYETLVTQLAAPSGARPPSPLTAADIARIVRIHRPGNLQLARDHGCFADDDPRWFDGAQRLAPPAPEEPRAEDDALIGALIDGLASLAHRHGDLSDENERLRIALHARWGELARLLFASNQAHAWVRRRLRERSGRRTSR